MTLNNHTNSVGAVKGPPDKPPAASSKANEQQEKQGKRLPGTRRQRPQRPMSQQGAPGVAFGYTLGIRRGPKTHRFKTRLPNQNDTTDTDTDTDPDEVPMRYRQSSPFLLFNTYHA